MATYTWVISTLEYDLQPVDMDGAVIIAHWRCNADQVEGTGDQAVSYYATSYGTCGFSPDPTAPGYVPYADLTEAEVLGWCWSDGVDKYATEASLQANIDLQVNPVTAAVFRGNLGENLMGKDNKPQMITINDIEYDATTFTDEQVIFTNHCLDLDKKISNMNFQLQQLQVGKESFLKMLTESLEPVAE